MSAHSVSPPTFGMIWQRRIVYLVGFLRNVVSLCHTSVDSTGLSLWLSSTRISGKLALRPHRMHFELAELPAHRDVLRGRQVLVAQDDDFVFDQRGFEGVQRGRRQWFSEIDTGDFRTELDAQALDLKWRGGAGKRRFGRDVDVHRKPLELFVWRVDYGTAGDLINWLFSQSCRAAATRRGRARGAPNVRVSQIDPASAERRQIIACWSARWCRGRSAGHRPSTRPAAPIWRR